ncbi:MAG: FAD-binding oxidoreductase [Candidatus Dormibacteraeota bacterium]|uniref:FAD-binding oxidoreductase n=1 Tax=Candidatus Dormiibacter inghamiae TaxID=3127013 RepID=A0A934NCA2_9BACT|nr:FAD-binding oxidoreductase [Candidatus Dormibacteraeota bacterium]MBJ7605918.1 FAD-binding oxidoreductase [Candidatus Dormibacteraeota bacterium]
MESFGTPIWGLSPRDQVGALPDRCDVLIVGGGITGLGLLHWLRNVPGVVLVEQDRLGAGASGRNAGFLLSGTASCYAVAVRKFGRRRAQELWHFTVETHELLAEALGGRARSYRRLGSYTHPASAQEARDLEESVLLLREDGADVRLEEARLLNPRDGEVNPLEALLVLAARARHGSVREGVKVDGLEAGREGVRVRAGEAECLAGAVILATNAYTAQIVPGTPIAPIRAQMAASTGERPGLVQRPTYSDEGYRYWRQLADGTLLAGGYRNRFLTTEVGYEVVPTPELQACLDDHLRGLGQSGLTSHRWAGIMGFTETELPLVGPLPDLPNVYLSAGYNGHGMAYAFNCAKRLAEHLTGRRRVHNLFP